jgi:hypothetical protein
MPDDVIWTAPGGTSNSCKHVDDVIEAPTLDLKLSSEMGHRVLAIGISFEFADQRLDRTAECGILVGFETRLREMNHLRHSAVHKSDWMLSVHNF